jgi:adenine deaminase
VGFSDPEVAATICFHEIIDYRGIQEDELQLMTDAGFSLLQAIQTATVNPGKFLGREKIQGAIEVGKRADLVLLEADPLTDISNLRLIAAVLVRGRLLSRSDIDRIISAHRHAPPNPLAAITRYRASMLADDTRGCNAS